MAGITVHRNVGTTGGGIFRNPKTKGEAADILGYSNVKVWSEDEAVTVGPLGLAVYMAIELSEASWTDRGKSYTTPAMLLDCCIATISLDKIIVKTQVAGRNGTVKELMSNGDFRVTIDGIFTGLGHDVPYDEIEQLSLIAGAPTPIPVVDRLLNKLGIYHLLIESFSLDGGEGNMQRYSLSCVSDDPTELEIKKNRGVIIR